MFTKLFSSITTSSIWNEDNNTRIVWITMLAMSDRHGYVSASIGGLAHEARVTKEECEKALEVLSSPDLDSRSKEFEGRRVQVVDGGFQLLNHSKYRAIRSDEERKEYMKSYMIEYRKLHVNKTVNNVSKCKQMLTPVNPGKPPLANTEAETESEAEADTKKEVASLPSPLKPEKKIILTDKSPYKEAVNGWMKSYVDVLGVTYGLSKGDEFNLKKLLDSGISVSRILELAPSAWTSPANGPHKFERGHSLQLSSFCSQFNKIQAAFGAKASPKVRDSYDDLVAKGVVL